MGGLGGTIPRMKLAIGIVLLPVGAVLAWLSLGALERRDPRFPDTPRYDQFFTVAGCSLFLLGLGGWLVFSFFAD